MSGGSRFVGRGFGEGQSAAAVRGAETWGGEGGHTSGPRPWGACGWREGGVERRPPATVHVPVPVPLPQGPSYPRMHAAMLPCGGCVLPKCTDPAFLGWALFWGSHIIGCQKTQSHKSHIPNASKGHVQRQQYGVYPKVQTCLYVGHSHRIGHQYQLL